MEKKLKFSEFAELIGVTAKTVYKMKDREEIKTVIEKVNGREIQLVITTVDEIEKFRSMNGKGLDNNGYCEDMLTNSEASMNFNNPSQSYNNQETIKDLFDKIIEVNKEYNDRITKLNEELLDSKSKLLLLEDKAGREGLYLSEINELKTLNRGLKKWLIVSIVTLIVVLFSVFVGSITYNIVSASGNEEQIEKREPVIQEVHQNVEKPVQPARMNKKH